MLSDGKITLDEFKRNLRKIPADDFTAGTEAAEALAVGNQVKLIKKGTHFGEYAVVTDTDWNGRIKVIRDADQKVGSYSAAEIETIKPMDQAAAVASHANLLASGGGDHAVENPLMSPSAVTPDRRGAGGLLVPPAVASRPAVPSLAGLMGSGAGAAAPMGLQPGHGGGGWGSVMQHQREQHTTAVARRAATWLVPARPVDVGKLPPHELHQARQHAALDDRVDRLLFSADVEPIANGAGPPRDQQQQQQSPSSRGPPPALPRPSLGALVPSGSGAGNGYGHGSNAMFGTGAAAAGRWSAVGHATLAARGFEVTTRPPV